MNDTIYRQAAIYAICEGYCGGRYGCKFYPNCSNLTPIQNLPSARQWIPCEKELPKSEEEVIVSIHDDSGDTAYDYTSSGWYAAAGKFWVVENETNMRVVAWMPLPEPYKGGIE